MASSTLRIAPDTLRTLRLKAFLTQEELAAKSGMSTARIKQIEAGTHTVTTPSTVRKLAEALRCEPSQLAEIVEASA